MAPGTRLTAALGAAGAVLALGGCDALESQVYQQNAVVQDTVTQVRMEGGAGSVTIGTGSGASTSIEQTIRYRGDRPTVATHRLDAGSLVLDTDCGRHCSAHYRVTVPAGVAVTGGLGSGDIELTGVASVDIETGSGTVTVAGVTGAVTADADSGDIDARDISGTVDAHTGSGTVTVAGVTGAVTADADSGDIDARDISGTVDAHTGSGTIDIRLAIPESVRVSAGSGDIFMTVPEGRYRIVARTDIGDRTVTVPDDPTATRTLDVHTGSGTVTVRPG